MACAREESKDVTYQSVHKIKSTRKQRNQKVSGLQPTVLSSCLYREKQCFTIKKNCHSVHYFRGLIAFFTVSCLLRFEQKSDISSPLSFQVLFLRGRLELAGKKIRAPASFWVRDICPLNNNVLLPVAEMCTHTDEISKWCICKEGFWISNV